MQRTELPQSAGLILIVDDVPDNVAVLHDTLVEADYTVLVATDGESALRRARNALPDLVLLDALMPGMDGFEVARRLRADPDTELVPIVFMTGLSETEHVIAGFAAGGTDYVTKPLKPLEVVVRVATHIRNARRARQSNAALEAFGQCPVSLYPNERRVQAQSLRGRLLLETRLDCHGGVFGQRVERWMREASAASESGQPIPTLSVGDSLRRVSLTVIDPSNAAEWLAVLREESGESDIEALVATHGLTLRQAEVLYWVVKGKTSRDIGEILGSSPRTVDKHLEHIFEKLGVETRTSAASIALESIRSASTKRP